MTLANLSDQELLTSLSTVCFEARRLLGRILLHLIEVEERRLDLRSACSSLYDFCLRRLDMSESEAVRRIEAARLVKRFPRLIGPIERGEIHLTALLLLRDHFTTDNVSELVAAASGKTKLEVQMLIAARAPKADVLTTLTPLGAEVRTAAPSPAKAAPQPKARIEPLAPQRHRLELTISDAVRVKLERARALMSHSVGRDLEVVLDEALDALLVKLEKERCGGGVPRAVRREVFERDGEQCTFTNADGNRCPSREALELDHIIPQARGGTHDSANLRVVCQAHNLLYAEQAFGRQHVERQIHLRQRQRRSPDSTFDTAHRALRNLGFREPEVREALRRVLPADEPNALAARPPMTELLRSALSVLSRGATQSRDTGQSSGNR